MQNKKMSLKTRTYIPSIQLGQSSLNKSNSCLVLKSNSLGQLGLNLLVLEKGKIKYLHDITANYRSLRNSACHFTDQKKEFLFYLDAMRVREYYASLAGKESVAQPYFRKRAVFILNQCYKNHWKDFPVDKVWHFVEKYGNPSGYDRLKFWGMGSDLRYLVSRIILRIKKKSLG